MPLETLLDVPRASFLGLPLEIRQQIYSEYFTTEGGYIYDVETDKLVQANRCPIDLSLRHVCRTIALETYHCPFTLNNITFSTAYRRDWRKQAAAVDFISTYHHFLQLSMLIRLRHCLTSDMYEQPIKQYSKYMPLIVKGIADIISRERRSPKFNAELLEMVHIRDFMERPGSDSKAGNPLAISIYDNNVSRNRTYAYLLRKIANQYPEKFKEAIDKFLPGWTDCKPRPASDFFSLGFDLWAIPSLPQVTAMVEQLQLTERWDRLDQWHYSEVGKEGFSGTKYCYQRKHFFSAAALAIRFLNNISQAQRLFINNLILNEDRMAVGHPECHIIGMIPFVEENPSLLIKHKVNLWRNILPRSAKIEVSSFPTTNESNVDLPESVPSPHQVFSNWAGKEISHFIMHTMEALREGLPATSYSFVFDGEPDSNHSTETFKYLMELPIAWITNHTDCVAEGLLASPESSGYPFMTVPSSDEHISGRERTSIIECNFTLDQPWDYKHIAGNDNRNINRWKTLDKVHRFANETDGEYADKLDVSNGIVDWMKIKGEYFEMKLLSDVPGAATKALDSSGSLSE
ncbi:uncharacterized protein FMAN_12001 [Fusarium mangiferae]|uniref:Uncharacterized protein n=1 Tax=Fusarium mangiferae TaxID=192010 RepID=A0A1L7U836_FUSMA|nr:uncharacterized protein FMAN_12001 [Fusarium mangiferae]CVL06908.1 uncharacterized protein FMAN_12001 [Fusarium mangiferae]